MLRRIHTVRARIRAADGVELSITAFHAGSARRAALVLPATGVTQQRYHAFARFLADQGWFAVTFDYRGIGASALAPASRHKASMQAWGEQDLAAVIDWAAAQCRGGRIVAIGHSIGGQIVSLAANSHRIDAVLGVATQKGYHPLWDAPTRYLVQAFFRAYIPVCLALFDRVPLGWAGLDDLERNVALDYARWTRHLDYTDASGCSLLHRFRRFRAPILALSFSDDTSYAPPSAVDFLLRHYYVNAPVWRCHVAPHEWGLDELGHSGFFDPARCPPACWKEASDWLAHAAAGYALDRYDFRVFTGAKPLVDHARLSAEAAEQQRALDPVAC